MRVFVSLAIIANGAFSKKLSSAANRARTKNPRNVEFPIAIKVTKDCVRVQDLECLANSANSQRGRGRAEYRRQRTIVYPVGSVLQVLAVVSKPGQVDLVGNRGGL